ncbi:beta-N-acetylhexosaminidase [Utexia brackfieldae]
MLDVAGKTLTAEDREILRHPSVGGVIFFARNFENVQQLRELITQIREASHDRLLLAVDHEGGRVQRFRDGFTSIPPAKAFAKLQTLPQAKRSAFDAGWLIASELTSLDIDISFTPVLDLGHQCPAIGDRSFHDDINIATSLASAMIDGLHEGGMKVTGKHFPGHGAVDTDSHKVTPFDRRQKTEIQADMAIFSQLIDLHKLDAIMPAHVIYPVFDDRPASGSAYWLKTVLRQKLNFTGVIFSDDLSMEGAAFMGNYAQRTLAALNAGCDIALICNNRPGVIEALDALSPLNSDKPKLLFHQNRIDYHDLIKTAHWLRCHDSMQRLNEQWLATTMTIC